ncbi:hypothetical protein NQ317_017785, partial [Molorchus minor]
MIRDFKLLTYHVSNCVNNTSHYLITVCATLIKQKISLYQSLSLSHYHYAALKIFSKCHYENHFVTVNHRRYQIYYHWNCYPIDGLYWRYQSFRSCVKIPHALLLFLYVQNAPSFNSSFTSPSLKVLLFNILVKFNHLPATAVSVFFFSTLVFSSSYSLYSTHYLHRLLLTKTIFISTGSVVPIFTGCSHPARPVVVRQVRPNNLILSRSCRTATAFFLFVVTLMLHWSAFSLQLTRSA